MLLFAVLGWRADSNRVIISAFRENSDRDLVSCFQIRAMDPIRVTMCRDIRIVVTQSTDV